MSRAPTPSPQLTLELFAPEPPSFDNFITGCNAEAVQHLRQVVARHAMPTAVAACRHAFESACICLWGPTAVGKTHLLSALEAAHASALRVTTETLTSSPFIEQRLLLIDDVDRLSPTDQGWLFTAFNHVTQRGGAVIATLSRPPLATDLRPDLRSRLGSGLVFELAPLPEEALPDLLRRHCAARGFAIDDEVIAYVLTHHRRDARSLRTLLSAMDRLSLAERRPVTMALARTAMAALAGG